MRDLKLSGAWSRTGVAALLFVLLLNLHAARSSACSLSEAYLRPSNYELVKETDAILLAEAISFDKRAGTKEKTAGLPFPSEFTFKILEVVKGEFTQETLAHGGINTYLGKGDENDFGEVRPGAGTGACNAYDYQVGSKFLLFVNKTEGGWRISGAPFSRINEEVSGPDSPWVVAVRHYARVGSLDDYEAEKAELKKLSARAAAGKEAKNYPPALVADIEGHFKSPYPTKSFRDLVKLYEESPGERRGRVLWAFARGKHPEAKTFFQNLLRTGKWEEHVAPVSEYVRETKDHSFTVTLGELYLKLGEKSARWPIMQALVEVAAEEDSALMLAALKSADEEEAARLAVWFVKYPDAEATAIIRSLVGAKYRERWELAFGLAGLGDEAVLRWAEAFVKTSDEDRWMGHYVIARSPTAEADALARALIRANRPEDLVLLIQGYEDSENPHRWDRLRDLVNLKSGDSQVDYWLRRTLADMAERGDARAAELLATMKK